jgi:hypothetical protein
MQSVVCDNLCAAPCTCLVVLASQFALVITKRRVPTDEAVGLGLDVSMRIAELGLCPGMHRGVGALCCGFCRDPFGQCLAKRLLVLAPPVQPLGHLALDEQQLCRLLSLQRVKRDRRGFEFNNVGDLVT